MAPSPMKTHQSIAYEIAFQLREILEEKECDVEIDFAKVLKRFSKKYNITK